MWKQNVRERRTGNSHSLNTILCFSPTISRVTSSLTPNDPTSKPKNRMSSLYSKHSLFSCPSSKRSPCRSRSSTTFIHSLGLVAGCRSSRGVGWLLQVRHDCHHRAAGAVVDGGAACRAVSAVRRAERVTDSCCRRQPSPPSPPLPLTPSCQSSRCKSGRTRVCNQSAVPVDHLLHSSGCVARLQPTLC